MGAITAVDAAARSLPAAALTALTEAAAAISSTLEVEAVLQTISRLAARVTHAEAGALLLFDSRANQFHVAAASGSRREALLGQDFDAALGIPGHVLRTGQPINLTNAPAHSRFHKPIDDMGSLRTRCILAVPMLQRGQVIGVIQVANRVDETVFDESDERILQVFATLAAAATENARAHEDLKRRYEGLHSAALKDVCIVGQSPPLQRVLNLCNRAAPTNTTVLLLGETGTGKEMCARYIHMASKRRDEPFVAINCAALPETLLESELFGHERGAFTGAVAQRRGWFELADGGTLLLDEIGDITRSTQAKLLRVLQEHEFVRIGGTRPVPCNVRVIAATNRNLKNMMTDGLFRDDLYYRLSVFPVELPPLRDRQEDIPRLVDHFVQRSIQPLRIDELAVAPRTMDLLIQYPWPGNIRELQNVIERSVLMSDGNRLLPSHLPPELEAAADGNGEEDGPGQDDRPETTTLFGQERTLIVRTLEACGWNQSQAARALGITRDYLRHRVKKYRIQKPATEADPLASS